MLRTFRIGGIHPPENKLSAGKKITALAAPKQVIIPPVSYTHLRAHET